MAVKKKAKSDTACVYVVAGKDAALVGARCVELIEELVDPGERTTGLFDADPSSVSISDVLDELRTLPFLTSRRVVVLKNAEGFVSQNRESLENYFDDPCATGVLVLTVGNWDSRTRLAKKLPKIGTLIEVKTPKKSELPGRLVQYAHDAHDKRLSRAAAGLLVEINGDELAQLYSEVDKLALYAEKDKTISESHVEALIGHNRVFGAFEVIDAVTEGHVGEAVSRLRNMFAEDRNAEYTVVGAFAYHLRQLFGARALLDKGVRPFDIYKRLRIWYRREQLLAQAGKMSIEQTAEYLRRLGRIDHDIKTGRTKARVAIEQMVLKLASG